MYYLNFFKYRIGNPKICDYELEDLTAYLPTEIVCPDNCTSEYHGTCDCATGLCMCNDGYSGDNCGGTTTITIGNTTTATPTGNTTIPSQLIFRY